MEHHNTVYFAILFTVGITLSGCETTKKEGEDDNTNKVRENSTEKPIDQEELELDFENISFSHKEANCQQNVLRAL